GGVRQDAGSMQGAGADPAERHEGQRQGQGQRQAGHRGANLDRNRAGGAAAAFPDFGALLIARAGVVESGAARHYSYPSATWVGCGPVAAASTCLSNGGGAARNPRAAAGRGGRRGARGARPPAATQQPRARTQETQARATDRDYLAVHGIEKSFGSRQVVRGV